MQIPKFTKAEINPIKKLMLKDGQLNPHDTNYESYFAYQNYYFQSEHNEIMIRKHQGAHAIVLARIQMNQQHIGHATTLLKLLESIATKNHYQYVIVESILTTEMWGVVYNLGYKKQGFNAVKAI